MIKWNWLLSDWMGNWRNDADLKWLITLPLYAAFLFVSAVLDTTTGTPTFLWILNWIFTPALIGIYGHNIARLHPYYVLDYGQREVLEWYDGLEKNERILLPVNFSEAVSESSWSTTDTLRRQAEQVIDLHRQKEDFFKPQVPSKAEMAIEQLVETKNGLLSDLEVYREHR